MLVSTPLKMKLILSIVLLITLLFGTSSFLAEAGAATMQAPSPGPSCSAMCNARCLKAGVYKRCYNYCCICCSKCKCVPSGTYGNKSECPCYRDMLNSKGKSKCP